MVVVGGLEPPVFQASLLYRQLESPLSVHYQMVCMVGVEPTGQLTINQPDMPVLLHARGGPSGIRTQKLSGFEPGAYAVLLTAHIQLAEGGRVELPMPSEEHQFSRLGGLPHAQPFRSNHTARGRVLLSD